MQNYSAIVESHAKDLNAKIVSIESFEAFANSPQLAMRILDAVDEEQCAWSDVTEHKLFVKLPIKSELGCFIAMHELGHIATTDPNSPPGDIEAEAQATQWALDHIGFQISPKTAAETLDALNGYQNPGIMNKDPQTPGPFTFRVNQELEPIAKRAHT